LKKIKQDDNYFNSSHETISWHYSSIQKILFTMSNKGKYKQYKFENDLDRGDDHDPDFDLDEYIRQQSMDHSRSTDIHAPVDEETSQFKNAILMFLVFAAAFLWANDWSPTQAWGSIFGGEEASTEVTSTAPSFTIPDIPDFPDIAPLPSLSTEAGFVDYLREINEAGLDDMYSSSGYSALYQSGVTIEYLTQLNEAGYLNKFSYSAIIGLFNGGVSLDYLNSLNESGYIDQFSYSAIIGLYNGGVTTEYLDALNENGYIDTFSYSGIIGLFNGGVTVDYLDQLAENRYLDTFSYSGIIGMYNSGVTVEFLNQLAENNLLEGMSYTDVIVAFNADN
jgi:hypothetical protein